jgi:hypothetical protein
MVLLILSLLDARAGPACWSEDPSSRASPCEPSACRLGCVPPTMQVRQLICMALTKLYVTADLLPLYACVNDLQAYCQDRDKSMPEVRQRRFRGTARHGTHDNNAGHAPPAGLPPPSGTYHARVCPPPLLTCSPPAWACWSCLPTCPCGWAAPWGQRRPSRWPSQRAPWGAAPTRWPRAWRRCAWRPASWRASTRWTAAARSPTRRPGSCMRSL